MWPQSGVTLERGQSRTGGEEGLISELWSLPGSQFLAPRYLPSLAGAAPNPEPIWLLRGSGEALLTGDTSPGDTGTGGAGGPSAATGHAGQGCRQGSAPLMSTLSRDFVLIFYLMRLV